MENKVSKQMLDELVKEVETNQDEITSILALIGRGDDVGCSVRNITELKGKSSDAIIRALLGNDQMRKLIIMKLIVEHTDELMAAMVAYEIVKKMEV